MPSEKATAIVIRVVDFSETSVVATLFTREFGKVSGLAKGARRPKGPFEAALDLLSTCRVVFLRKSSGALDLLTEAKLEQRFRPPDGQLAALYGGYYVAELLAALTDEYDPHPELFDAARETLLALRDPGTIAISLLRFELLTLRLLGHLPSLSQCVECGRPLKPQGRLSFGHLAGGLLCANCRPGKRQVVSVRAGVVRALARFADDSSDVWRRLELDRKTYGELRGVLNRYMAHLMGRQSRLHGYLKTLNVG